MPIANSCIITPGFEFEQSRIEDAIARRGLLSMEIELSRSCNFRCPYCYAASTAEPGRELTDAEVRDVVGQARDLGALKIIILGGEPMLHPRLFPTIEYIRDLGLAVDMFTNGSGVTPEKARKLFRLEVGVALKMNSFNRNIQDMLAGRAGGYDIIHSAFRNLQEAGYPAPDHKPFLAVSTVMCTLNIDELVPLWIWARDNNILPYFEMVTPAGRAVENDWLSLTPEQNRAIFSEINRIDRQRYRRSWIPQPPLVANRCQRHKYSCLVNNCGEVTPCVGIPITVGDIRQRRLADILAESEVIQDLRDHRRRIKGPCGDCALADHCYGCRGAAYHLTGDYLQSDPRCWNVLERQDEIERLPLDIGPDIPHQPPMRLVDKLLRVGERSGETIAEIRPDTPFVGIDGRFDTSMYIELVAQSIAALHGFQNRRNGQKAEGFLLGAKSFRIRGAARAGDVLNIAVFKSGRFGEFGIVQGVIRKGETVLAAGEIKIWQKHESGGKAG